MRFELLKMALQIMTANASAQCRIGSSSHNNSSVVHVERFTTKGLATTLRYLQSATMASGMCSGEL